MPYILERWMTSHSSQSTKSRTPLYSPKCHIHGKLEAMSRGIVNVNLQWPWSYSEGSLTSFDVMTIYVNGDLTLKTGAIPQVFN